MAWHVWACDTITGKRLYELPQDSFTWSRALNGGGSGRATFQLGDPRFKGLDWRDLLDLWRRTLVLEWEEEMNLTGTRLTAVYAGVIQSRTYDYDAKTLTVEHADIWCFFNRRHVVNTHTTGVATTKLEYKNLSLGTLAKRAVTEGMDAPYPQYDLPIVFPNDATGSNNKTWHGYQVTTVADALDWLMKRGDGPDIEFRPVWKSDGDLEWEMRVNEGFGSFEWNLSAGNTGMTSISVTEDGTKLTNNVFVIGEGSEVDTVIRGVRNNASVYPSLETSISMKSADEKQTAADLDSYANEYLRAHKRPTVQWSASVQAEAQRDKHEDNKRIGASVADLRLGSLIHMYFSDDPFIPDGYQENELIGFSGDLGAKVKLEFQTIGAA